MRQNLSFTEEPEGYIEVGGDVDEGFLLACMTVIAQLLVQANPNHTCGCAFCKASPKTMPNPLPTKEQPMIQHSEMVSALVKSGEAILQQLTPAQADLWHAATGVVGEAGELIDAVKKHVVYSKALDRENVIEELGDLEFYMEQLRQNLGISREQTLEGNIAKLSKRYEGLRYTDAAAHARADKEAGQ